MKNLDQDLIIQRIKNDAKTIAKTYQIDVSASVLKELQSTEIISIEKSSRLANTGSNMIQNALLTMVGVAALALLVTNLVLPISNRAVPSTQKATQIAALIENQALKEKETLKADIVYISQVFSL